MRHSQPMSRPNDQVSRARARATTPNVTAYGRIPGPASSNRTPWRAATVLRAVLGGRVPLSQGWNLAAATNA